MEEKEIFINTARYPTLETYYDYNDPEELGEVEIMAEILGDNIIRYNRNRSEKRPYKLCVMERELDETTGRGIADSADPLAGVVNGIWRAFEDNKKLSANVVMAKISKYLMPGQDTSLVNSTNR